MNTIEAYITDSGEVFKVELAEDNGIYFPVDKMVVASFMDDEEAEQYANIMNDMDISRFEHVARAFLDA